MLIDATCPPIPEQKNVAERRRNPYPKSSPASSVASARSLFAYRNFGAFRLLLAVMVMAQHLFAAFAPTDVALLANRYEVGSVAVLVFFALSGFVIVEAVDARQLVGLMAAGRLGIVRRLVDVDESARMIEVRHGHFAKRVLELHFKS